MLAELQKKDMQKPFPFPQNLRSFLKNSKLPSNENPQIDPKGNFLAENTPKKLKHDKAL